MFSFSKFSSFASSVSFVTLPLSYASSFSLFFSLFYPSLLLRPTHKVLTYVDYRAVSGVFQNIDPPPLHPASVSSPRTKGGGDPLTWGGGGVNILEDARHWIGLLQYNLSLQSNSSSFLVPLSFLSLPLTLYSTPFSSFSQNHKRPLSLLSISPLIFGNISFSLLCLSSFSSLSFSLFFSHFHPFFKSPLSHPILFCRVSLFLILLSFSLLKFLYFSLSLPLSSILYTLESDSCCSVFDK
jgi:hypothetical protein